MRRSLTILALVSVLSEGNSHARAESWLDPSPHNATMITVQPNVAVEMLDWGGSGKSLVLIAGIGGTAHTFDDFALLLTPHFHVYRYHPSRFWQFRPTPIRLWRRSSW
jgi:non-heme chloroperoxidase